MIKTNTTLSTSSNDENIEDIPMDSGASGRRIMNSMFASENSLEVRVEQILLWMPWLLT